MHRIGLISDTHGLLRPEALALLKGCEHIVHAGDIGDPEILESLAQLAPVTAVRGNNDKGTWARILPEIDCVRIERVSILIIHDLKELDSESMRKDVRVIVSGHSHRPNIEDRDGVLYVNPGSAGPRRFKLPISIAELRIGDTSVNARLVKLLP